MKKWIKNTLITSSTLASVAAASALGCISLIQHQDNKVNRVLENTNFSEKNSEVALENSSLNIAYSIANNGDPYSFCFNTKDMKIYLKNPNMSNVWGYNNTYDNFITLSLINTKTSKYIWSKSFSIFTTAKQVSDFLNQQSAFNYGDVLSVSIIGNSNILNGSIHKILFIDNNGQKQYFSHSPKYFLGQPLYFKIQKDGLKSWTPITQLRDLDQLNSNSQRSATITGTTIANSNVNVYYEDNLVGKAVSNSNGNFSVNVISEKPITADMQFLLSVDNCVPIMMHFYNYGGLTKSSIYLSATTATGAIYFNTITNHLVFNDTNYNGGFAPNFTTENNSNLINNFELQSDNSTFNNVRLILPNPKKIIIFSVAILDSQNKILNQTDIWNYDTRAEVANRINNMSFKYGDKISILSNYQDIFDEQLIGVNNYNQPIWYNYNGLSDNQMGWLANIATITKEGLVDGQVLDNSNLMWIDALNEQSTANVETGVGLTLQTQGWQLVDQKAIQSWQPKYTKGKGFVALQGSLGFNSTNSPSNSKDFASEFQTNAAFKEKVAQLVKEAPNIPGHSRDWAIALYIQQWVSKNMTYEDFGDQDVQWVFDNLKGVCWNYAMLYAVMCAQAGLVAAMICGVAAPGPFTYYTQLSAGHSYNMVYIPDQKRWIFVDPTWGIFNVEEFVNNNRTNMTVTAVFWPPSKKYMEYFNNDKLTAFYYMGVYWNQTIENYTYKISMQDMQEILENA